MKALILFFLFASPLFASHTVKVKDPKTGKIYTTGLFVPPGAFDKADFAKFTPEELADLPESYEVPVTSVKNQGSCGSCSHFASTAVYESLLIQKHGATPDLSEQNLLDCGRYNNYKCNGSFQHFQHLIEKGQALETDFPYRGRATRCQTFTPAAEKPVKWGNLGTQGRRPTVDEVRAGLVKYGAMWITLDASNWGRPGAQRRCNTRGQTNHAVTVVGYRPDPSYPGKYLFKIKNSWGTAWNGNGYVEQWLGCDNLGETVSYMELAK